MRIEVWFRIAAHTSLVFLGEFEAPLALRMIGNLKAEGCEVHTKEVTR